MFRPPSRMLQARQELFHKASSWCESLLFSKQQGYQRFSVVARSIEQLDKPRISLYDRSRCHSTHSQPFFREISVVVNVLYIMCMRIRIHASRGFTCWSIPCRRFWGYPACLNTLQRAYSALLHTPTITQRTRQLLRSVKTPLCASGHHMSRQARLLHWDLFFEHVHCCI